MTTLYRSGERESSPRYTAIERKKVRMNQNFQTAISPHGSSMFGGIRSWLVVTALEDLHEVSATSTASS